MTNKQLAALFAVVLAIGALVGAVWGFLTLAELMDQAEQEIGS